MARPKLQVALDCASVEEAFCVLKTGVEDVIDIREVGTVLIMNDGIRAVSILRSAYPDKEIVADANIIGAQFGTAMLARKPDYLTISTVCTDDAIKKTVEAASEQGTKCQIQFSSYSFSKEDFAHWKDLGIEYLVFDKPSEGAWTNNDIAKLQEMCDMGFKVSAAGGITLEYLDALAGLPITTVVCGSSIRKAEDPKQAALLLKKKCEELWK